MVAAFLPLDHGVATVAALPTFFLRLFQDACDFGVFGTFGGFVHPVPAQAADFGFASVTCGEFPAALAVDVHGFDPVSASWGGAVQPVPGVVLLILPGPFGFEFVVEENVDVFFWYGIFSAAPRWHVLRVFER